MARPKLDAPNYRLERRGRVYYVRWWEDGRDQRVSTRTEEKREAQQFLSQFLTGLLTPEPPNRPIVGQILDGYLENRKSEVRSWVTLQAACNALRRHLGDLEPSHMTEERGKLYARQRRLEGHEVGRSGAKTRKPTSDGTIIREVVTLRAAFRWAMRQKWITHEPYVPAPSGPPPTDRWLTREEYDRLLEAALASHVRLFIALALHTGARSGAILALQWGQVDLQRQLIQLGRGRRQQRPGDRFRSATT